MSQSALDLEQLGLDQGATLLLRYELARLAEGDVLDVHGSARDLAVHLRAFARSEGHGFTAVEPRQQLTAARAGSGAPLVARLVRGSASSARWVGAERAGHAAKSGVVEHPSQSWGLAARGAAVEAGGPTFSFAFGEQAELWADEAAELYRAAVAAQWEPALAVPWDAPRAHPEFVEDALVQVLTYLIENETAALVVPAKLCAQVHPHFREIMQLLAIQAADEARHIDVFTRRPYWPATTSACRL